MKTKTTKKKVQPKPKRDPYLDGIDKRKPSGDRFDFEEAEKLILAKGRKTNIDIQRAATKIETHMAELPKTTTELFCKIAEIIEQSDTWKSTQPDASQLAAALTTYLHATKLVKLEY